MFGEEVFGDSSRWSFLIIVSQNPSTNSSPPPPIVDPCSPRAYPSQIFHSAWVKLANLLLWLTNLRRVPTCIDTLGLDQLRSIASECELRLYCTVISGSFLCSEFFFWSVLYCPGDKLILSCGKSLGRLFFHVSRMSPLGRKLVQWIFWDFCSIFLWCIAKC